MSEKILKGKTLSAGLGRRTAFIQGDVFSRFDEFYDIEDEHVSEELKRFRDAIGHISAELDRLAEDVEKEIDTAMSGIFHAHRAMLEDDTLQQEVEKEVRNELVSAGSAVKTVFRRWERRFRTMEAEVSKQKADDMKDLARRLIRSLAGIKTHALESFKENEEKRRQHSRQALKEAHKAAVTESGQTITVLANIAGRDDARTAMENGAEGIGLYRTENIYLGQRSPPDEEQLYNEMKNALEPAGERPVTVRLLDIGADKTLPYIQQDQESNPALGLRGIRFLLHYPDLLNTQLRALLRLSRDFKLSILIPMVTTPDDVQQVKEKLKQTAADLHIDTLPPLGAMIETPAAALSAKAISRHADFLSIGTNDLTQYTFAVDRENAMVDDYFDDTAEALFRLIQMIAEDSPGRNLSVCGELAARPEQTERILSYGITTLSVPPPMPPRIKETIRGIRL